MESIAESALHLALRGLNLRQRVIANNVANADTPRFKAGEVRFEEELRQALRRAPDGAALREQVIPRIVVPENRVSQMDENSVDMDRQLLALTETSMRYNAVSRALGERLALYRSVLSDGRT